MVSLQNLHDADKIELVIAAWPCDNIKFSGWSIPVRVVQMEKFFNVNMGHNAAARRADAIIRFHCDTDLLLPMDAVDVLLDKTKKGQCYFPIWQSETEDRSHVVWRTHSFGNAAFHRDDYDMLNGLSEEQAISWGGDIDIFNKIKKIDNLVALRERWDGLWHQWHPKPKRNFYNAVDDKSKY